jgi:hypothetical protein
VADKSSQLVLNALTRATADAAGVPLHGSRTAPGLFPATTLGKQAAQRCRDEGFLRSLATETNETTPRARVNAGPVCTITEKGLSFLLSQVSPRQVLEDFVRVLEAREEQVMQLVNRTRQMHSSLEALRSAVTAVLAEVERSPFSTRQSGNGDLNELFQEFRREKPENSPIDSTPALLAYLDRWAGSGALEDCPLPELFRNAQGTVRELTIGGFHDMLRSLQNAGEIYLHPWTGPLYDIPEPPYALLVGHEVAYYASRRIHESGARNGEE